MKNQKDIYIGNHITINSKPGSELNLHTIDEGKGKVFGLNFTLEEHNWKLCFRKVDVVNGVSISELIVYYWKTEKEKKSQ